MSTLIVAAHLDDEVISCGGLIQQRVKQGIHVDVLFVYGRKYPSDTHQHVQLKEEVDREIECAEQARHILKYNVPFLTALLEEGEPHQVGYYNTLSKVEHFLGAGVDEVVVPSGRDMNQDHRFLSDVCKIALRPANLGRVKRILQWRSMDTDLVRPSYYIPLTKPMLETKLRAINCYEREARVLPHPRAPENIEALHRVYGSYCGHQFAEGYDVIFAREDLV